MHHAVGIELRQLRTAGLLRHGPGLLHAGQHLLQAGVGAFRLGLQLQQQRVVQALPDWLASIGLADIRLRRMPARGRRRQLLLQFGRGRQAAAGAQDGHGGRRECQAQRWHDRALVCSHPHLHVLHVLRAFCDVLGFTAAALVLDA